MYHQFKELADVDITAGPMEVGPTTHYIMGGMRVEPDTAATTVPGLFAAGEAAAGLHGANRLGGNSLSDLIVFGKRAGEGAAQYAKSLGSAPRVDDSEVQAEIADLLAPFSRSSGESPYDVHKALQDVMDKNVGIFRQQAEMERAVEDLQALKKRAAAVRVTGDRTYNPGWHLSRDLRNMLIASESIARSAALRKESRGGHARLDFPNLDPAFGKVNHCTKLVNGEMQVGPTPLPEMPAELKALFEAKEAPKPAKEAVK
jgi:succinate dehydrogenase / fumarate reductase, flavoprotein subunit